MNWERIGGEEDVLVHVTVITLALEKNREDIHKKDSQTTQVLLSTSDAFKREYAQYSPI